MLRDRVIQIVAILLAIAGIAVAGSLLPRIVDRAGEQYLIVREESGATKTVTVNSMREMETVTPTKRTSAEPFQLTFDSGARTWSGHLGDDVRISHMVDNVPTDVTGSLVGSSGYGLRYTDVAIDGAPPIVAVGTALGALRGLIVDYLWIKVNMMKEKGLFYEVMADADLITKLQPRFGEVWGFHGHNMAYNISVLTNTPEERWEWVQSGIDLVRKNGIRYNPNDVVLHKELAFWFAHKIDGVADDAHLYYKRELAREWQLLLGEPPPGYAERVAWIKSIADAPRTLEELEAKDPKVKELVQRLTEDLSGFDRQFTFKLDREFLMNIGQWRAVKDSGYAKLLNLESELKRTEGEAGERVQNRLFQAIDRTFGNPEYKDASEEFLAYLRGKVLREEYNMDPSLMWQYTRDTGPIDWRHPQAHALYWARRGGQLGTLRYQNEDDIYKVLNNDRIEIQAMQALARSGRMFYDPFANENPTRLNDPRWIKVLDRYFRRLYDKYYLTRGGGGDSFTALHENFMSQAVRELYHMGDVEGAQAILAELDTLYGSKSVTPNAKYQADLETFVRNITYLEYENQPEVARSDVYAALTRAFREGLLTGDKKLFDDELRFAADLTRYFKELKYNDFVNKFGEGRMKDLIGSLERSVTDVFRAILVDNSMPLVERLTIYNRAPEDLRRSVYDDVKGLVSAEFQQSRLANALSLEQVLPEPPGMKEFREARAAAAAAAKPATDERGEVERK